MSDRLDPVERAIAAALREIAAKRAAELLARRARLTVVTTAKDGRAA